jgi:hypothetical protein
MSQDSTTLQLSEPLQNFSHQDFVPFAELMQRALAKDASNENKTLDHQKVASNMASILKNEYVKIDQDMYTQTITMVNIVAIAKKLQLDVFAADPQLEYTMQIALERFVSPYLNKDQKDLFMNKWSGIWNDDFSKAFSVSIQPGPQQEVDLYEAAVMQTEEEIHENLCLLGHLPFSVDTPDSAGIN